MQADQLKQSIKRIEECADEAKRAVQAGSAPQELRQCVDTLHEQARQAQQQMGSSQQQGQDSIRSTVMQMEQAGDRAVQACRSAGNVDPQTQQAVQRAHDEISSLKKQIQMG
jgi:vacuolar-type H+-ATPase subunit H